MRAVVHGLTRSVFAAAPLDAAPETRHYYRHVTRLSAAFAFLADVSMLAMGGALKRKEKISGRLGDVLSMMYLVSATLKHYEDQGRIKADLPLVRWAVRDALYSRAAGDRPGAVQFPGQGAGDASCAGPSSRSACRSARRWIRATTSARASRSSPAPRATA